MIQSVQVELESGEGSSWLEPTRTEPIRALNPTQLPDHQPHPVDKKQNRPDWNSSFIFILLVVFYCRHRIAIPITCENAKSRGPRVPYNEILHIMILEQPLEQPNS